MALTKDNASVGGPTPAAGTRTPQIVGALQHIAMKFFREVSPAVFDEAVEYFFECAENADNNETQSRYFEGIREIKNQREAFLDRFCEIFRNQIGSIPGIQRPATSAAVDEEELSILNDSDLEESLATNDLASKLEIRYSQQLHALNQRLSVLNGGQTINHVNNPCGPQKIAATLREAGVVLKVAPVLRAEIYGIYDRRLMDAAGAYYDELNEYLINAGVLPNLKLEAVRTPDRPQPAPDAPGEPEVSEEEPGAPSQHFASAGASDWRMSTSEAQRDEEIFSAIRELLASRPSGRPHVAQFGGGGGQRYSVAPTEQVQQALSSLQRQRAAQAPPESFDQVREMLLSELETSAQPGSQPQLSPADSDTLDLVGMLFDYIQAERGTPTAAQSLLNQLQVPLLKIALQDKRLFTRRQHPARQFINTLADAGSAWIDEEDRESRTFQKMQKMVESITNEFDDDISIFERLLEDLNKHLTMLKRRADNAERRNVDAMRGREKLALSRQRADDEITARIAGAEPPEFIRVLLEQAWSDYLTLLNLRHGDDSDAYRKALTSADHIIESVDANLPPSRREDVKRNAPRLREDVRNALLQVGYRTADVDLVVGNLEVCQQWALEKQGKTEAPAELTEPLAAPPKPGATEPEEQPKPLLQRGRFGGEPEKLPDPGAAKKLTEGEKRMLAKLRLMPFGTWFEFTLNQQGDVDRRKLSWFSPVTSRCLFVNHRGVKVDDRSLTQLARDMVRGNARVYEPPKRALFDRALDTILGRLRKPVPA